ncbi:hypothetical protein QBC36DRAFT_313827 [Triangularia setosa]|uniref:Uncharacterized protein n=1 Tax=Triangularia setosa TaxID=2587417 RepID=A0AAN6W3A4_9PEZI|nr:hypothetical protein QBC36DRAFT_313827 [Podospora setosa]
MPSLPSSAIPTIILLLTSALAGFLRVLPRFATSMAIVNWTASQQMPTAEIGGHNSPLPHNHRTRPSVPLTRDISLYRKALRNHVNDSQVAGQELEAPRNYIV